jgi:HEAT repeat protein
MTGEDKHSFRPGSALRARLDGDVDALIEMLSTGDLRASVLAAGELRRLRDPRAVPALVDRLRASEPGGKVAALKALREIGDPRAAAAVADLAHNPSQTFNVRATAAQTLLRFGDRRGATTLGLLFGETTAKHHRAFRKWVLPLLVDANGTDALPGLRAARSELGVIERRRLDRAIQALERHEERDTA